MMIVTQPVFIIAAGVVGFVAGICADVCSLKRSGNRCTFVCWLLVTALMGYSHVAVAVTSRKFPLPVPVIWLGWVCLILGSLLLAYSLFLEIPFSKTYVKAESGKQLVHVGTYALTRHPGVLWYALLLTGLILASRSTLALVAAPIWFAMELLWIWIEDRFIFERTIAGYDEYKTMTPMVIPNRGSLVRCWDTLALRNVLMGTGPADENEDG